MDSTFSSLDFDMLVNPPAVGFSDSVKRAVAYNINDAHEAFEGVSKKITAKLRVSSPHWDVPIEIWRVIFSPLKN